MRLVAARPADGMTAVYFPDGVDGKSLLERLQTRFGVKLAGGQGPLKGRIFRIAHMGLVDELDILSSLAAIELVLAEMGQDVKLGASVAAASRVLAEAGGRSTVSQVASQWWQGRKLDPSSASTDTGKRAAVYRCPTYELKSNPAELARRQRATNTVDKPRLNN